MKIIVRWTISTAWQQQAEGFERWGMSDGLPSTPAMCLSSMRPSRNEMMTSSANEASSPADGGLASVPFDSRQLRDALGVFPTGIIVLTGHDAAGERIGMTMSSFNSVSLEPPLVLFSIHRDASSFSKWQQCSRFAINVL